MNTTLLVTPITQSFWKKWKTTDKEILFMKKYICNICGWIYEEALGDPDNGIAPGTKFDDLPDDFVCPLCGVGKDDFSEE